MRFSSHDQLVDQASREATCRKYSHICFKSLPPLHCLLYPWPTWRPCLYGLLPHRLKGHTRLELGKGQAWGIWFLASSSIGACELV